MLSLGWLALDRLFLCGLGGRCHLLGWCDCGLGLGLQVDWRSSRFGGGGGSSGLWLCRRSWSFHLGSLCGLLCGLLGHNLLLLCLLCLLHLLLCGRLRSLSFGLLLGKTCFSLNLLCFGLLLISLCLFQFNALGLFLGAFCLAFCLLLAFLLKLFLLFGSLFSSLLFGRLALSLLLIHALLLPIEQRRPEASAQLGGVEGCPVGVFVSAHGAL